MRPRPYRRHVPHPSIAQCSPTRRVVPSPFRFSPFTFHLSLFTSPHASCSPPRSSPHARSLAAIHRSHAPTWWFSTELNQSRSIRQKITGQLDGRVAYALFEGLLHFDRFGRPQPGIAQSWDISPDRLTYTFHLRPEAKWSNGDPVNANDFVASWKRALSPETASEYAYIFSRFEMRKLSMNGP